MQRGNRLRSILALALALTSLSFTQGQPAFAAVGDTDTVFRQVAGSLQYAVALDDAGFTIPNAITMEAWVKPDATCIAASECVILIKESSYTIGIVGGVFQWALMNAAWNWNTTGITPVVGVWQHVALTRAASTNATKFYLNGRLVATGTADGAGTSGLGDSNHNFAIGARNGSNVGLNATTAAYFSGEMDEIKVWQTERTQAQIQSDMGTYGPTNDSNLKLYYDFNDVSGSTISNKASGATSGTQLTLKNSPTFTSLETSTVSGIYRVISFPRTYLSANGFKVPSGVTAVDALVVGGGGGGGNNSGAGGSGGGGYRINSAPVNESTGLNIRVGTGGPGGRYTASGTLTNDGTTRMDGQDGESSTLVIGVTTYLGGGGSGGQTSYANNVCAGSGSVSVWNTAGTFSGTGGTGYTGALGGTPSTTQSVANGVSGFTDATTGTSLPYGSGGGAGPGASPSNFLAGVGADSLAGNGAATSTGVGLSASHLRGAGGGGGGSSCGAGGSGGSGVVILRYSTLSGEFTTGKNASATYRTATTFVLTLSSAGRVTFFANNKAIGTCRNIATSGSGPYTATCLWKPSVRANVAITARFTATSGGSGIFDGGTANVVARSGRR